MTKAKAVAEADKRYRVTSPVGIAAVAERARMVAGQSEDAPLESVARIYQAISLMLSALLEAGQHGHTDSELIAMVRAQVSLTRSEQDEALHIFRGHMRLVKDTVEQQKK